MGYISQGFSDGQVLKASQLIALEKGILANETSINALSETNSEDNSFQDCIITRYEPINKKVFKDKKLWVFGDSITAGVGTTSPNYFAQFLSDSLECASLKRLGNSGYAFSLGLQDGYSILDKMDTQLASAPGNCDILIICFGVNDWTWGRAIEGDHAIGSLLDTSQYTICGAVNLFCQKLQTLFADYPDTKIYFVTPTPTKNAPISGGNPSGKSWDQTKKNYNNNTLRDICNAIIQTSALYGYQSLDLNLYFDGDITDHDAMDEAFPDGLHPNEEGNKKMAITIEKLMIANPITSFHFNPLATTLRPLAKNLIYKEVKIIEAATPKITVQPVGSSYSSGSAPAALSITATTTDEGILGYQWYLNNTIINDATSNTYTPTVSADGTYSYYCVVSNTLGGSIKTVKSNVIKITIGEAQTPSAGTAVDLSSLAFNELTLSNASGDANIFYQTSDATISVNSTGWYKLCYAYTPLAVGMEVELTTHFGDTQGNALLIMSEDEINSPSDIAGSYWPGTKVFGIYAAGKGNEPLYQWDSSKANISDTLCTDLNGGKKVLLQLTAEGVKIEIDNVALTLPHYNALNSEQTYYFAIHMNGTSGTLGAVLNYIGPIR